MGMELKVGTYCVVQEILMENAYYQTLCINFQKFYTKIICTFQCFHEIPEVSL